MSTGRSGRPQRHDDFPVQRQLTDRMVSGMRQVDVIVRADPDAVGSHRTEGLTLVERTVKEVLPPAVEKVAFPVEDQDLPLGLSNADVHSVPRIAGHTRRQTKRLYLPAASPIGDDFVLMRSFSPTLMLLAPRR